MKLIFPWSAVALCGFAWAAGAMGQSMDVVMAYVGSADSSAYRGAQQGLQEAQAQGEFLGQNYRLDFVKDQRHPLSAVAIVAAVDAASLIALADANPGVAVINVLNRDDSVRQDCHPNLLHAIPHQAMFTDAIAQWRQLHPDDTRVEAQAWHPDFEKYAAAQLNKRYRQSFDAAMDDPAWAGWAAVKLVSDMVAREQHVEPGKLLEALRTQLAFDGQKGVDMSFRDNGQLRQPLLLVAGGKLVGEAPVRGVTDIENLDSLGPLECHK